MDAGGFHGELLEGDPEIWHSIRNESGFESAHYA